MRIGIITALAAEARTLAGRGNRLLGHAEFKVALAGPGPRRAAAAATQLLAEGCDALLSFGLAGGLDVRLRPGSLVIANAVCSTDGARYVCDQALSAALMRCVQGQGAIVAPLYGAEAPLLAAVDKQVLHQDLGVVAVDMESAAIARIAHAHGQPCAVLRCVVDPADFSVPRAALAGMGEDGRSRALATARALLAHPLELPALIRLALWYGGALRVLRGAAAAICA